MSLYGSIEGLFSIRLISSGNYPNISRQFKDNEFEYFDYIHESLRGDKKIISLIDKLRKHSKEFDD